MDTEYWILDSGHWILHLMSRLKSKAGMRIKFLRKVSVTHHVTVTWAS